MFATSLKTLYRAIENRIGQMLSNKKGQASIEYNKVSNG
ncbi:hypothetical protein ACUXAM_000263 [Staphylococcus epidermidis]